MKRNNAFVLRKIYDENLLIPIRSNEVGDEIIALNDMAAEIWESATENCSEEEVFKTLLKKYGLFEQSVEAQSIKAFISIMVEKKLLYRDM